MYRHLAKVLGAAVRQADILRCKPSFMYINMYFKHVRIPVQTSLHVHDRAWFLEPSMSSRPAQL